jgi:hypothetical protein
VYQFEEKMKVLDKEEEQLRYQRAKQRRLLGLDKEEVDILKWGVERDQVKVQRKNDAMTKCTDTLAIEEATLCECTEE